jgi:hypothetical protein
VLAAPLAAYAQPSDADILLRRATQLRERGQYEDALRLANRAVEVEDSGRTRGEVALCEVAMERWVDAERHLEAVLASPDDPWVSRRRLSLDATLADVRGHLGRVELVRGPAGARVEINGVAAGVLPLREALRVPSGQLVIVVRAEGYRDYRRDVQLFAGGTHFEEVLMESLRPATREPPPVAACGPGLVMRGGLCYAPTPPESAGSVRAGQVLLWGGVALGAAAALTAIGVGADGDRIAGAYTERCGQVYRSDCAAEYAAAQESLGSQAAVVNAMIAVSVVGVGAAVVGAVLEFGGRRRGPTALRVSPQGVSLRW